MAVTAALASGAACDLAAFSTSPRANPGLATGSADVVALAGADLVVVEGQTVSLSGHASRSLVGTPTLTWTQTTGPPAALSNPSSPTPTFTAPLGPARVVFALRASVGDEHDDDEIVIEVVRAGPLPRPALLPAPADVEAAPETPVELRLPWRDGNDAVVNPRCALRGTTQVTPDGDELVVVVRPARLPCAVVVDEDGSAGEAPFPARRTNRIAVVVWPAGSALPSRTRARAPALVDPGAFVDIVADRDTVVAAADGTPLALQGSNVGARFVAPRTVGPLTLLAERRTGNASGGGVLLNVAVRAGPDNAAPTVAAPAELAVRPGVRFRLAATASDADGDATTITRTQVLGAEARRSGVVEDVLVAPDVPGTLLFFISADDGTVQSAVVPVRVDVDPAVENRPPTLALPAALFVVPGARFVLDASAANDPDDGLIAATQIQQEPGDAIVLIPNPIDVATVALTAPAAAVELHFLLSAYDSGGLGVTARVTVTVEDAGPWVDPHRGDDVLGNGSVDAPFATVAGAVTTAARHRFSTLRLAAGRHEPFDGALPDGLGLLGGFVFDGTGYEDAHGDDDFQPTTLPLGPGGLTLTGADARKVEFDGGPLRAARSVSLVDTQVDGTLAVAPGARVVVEGGVLGGAVTVTSATLVLGDSVVRGGIDARVADLELRDVDVLGEPALVLDGGVALVRDGAFRSASTAVRLIGATTSWSGTIQSVGAVVAGLIVDGGSVELVDLEVTVEGEDEARAVVITGEAAVAGHVRASVTAAGRARGIEGDAVSLVDSSVRASGADAIAVAVADAVMARVVVDADGERVTALRATSGAIAASILRATSWSPGTADAPVAVVGAVSFRHVTLIGGTGLVADGGSPSARNVVIVAPNPFLGVVDVGVVGVVGPPIDEALCPRCVAAPAEAVDAFGRLTPDATLGAPNPLVDAADAAFAVDRDVEGDPVPAGAAPDLGADERIGP